MQNITGIRRTLGTEGEYIRHHQHLPIRHHQVLQGSPLLVILGSAFHHQLFGKEDRFNEVQGLLGQMQRFGIDDLDVGVAHVHLGLRHSENLTLLTLLLLHALLAHHHCPLLFVAKE